uniref:Clathrin heavy chain, putative n=1 Tax=Arundo donax TaxID=35708 RepID=A0A0A9ENN4_ARUDO
MLWQVWFQNIQQKSCCLPYHVSLKEEISYSIIIYRTTSFHL